MKYDQKIKLLGLIANFITVISYSSVSGMDAALGFTFLWMPVLWLVTFLVVVLILISERKVAFKSENRVTTVLALSICTPLPSLMLYYLIDYYSPAFSK